MLMLLLTFAFIGRAQQQQVNDVELTALFSPVNEIYFTFEAPADRPTLDALSRIISVDNVHDGRVFAYANRAEFEKFLKYNYTWSLLPHPGSLITNPRMLDRVDVKNITAWDFYPTYDAYIQMMNDYAANYPSICNIVEFGTSVQNRKLLAAHITSSVNSQKPEFLYTSSIHGDELTGYILMLRLIDYLLTNYGSIPRVTQLVDNINIYINPLANPDGTYKGGNNTVNGAIRANANYVDMNRNYYDPAAGPHPDGNAWQKETIAFMNFAENHHFVMSANFHGGAEVMNYPWDTWSRASADANWWELVSNEFADTAQTYSPGGYFDDFGTGVTNGYAWYTITGGRQDYMNYFQQCREVTIEISNTKTPPASQLPNFWNYNYRSLLNYMEQVTYGISGIVTDSITGQPVRAQVFVKNHDIDSSMVFSSQTDGQYYRLIKGGIWTLQVSAPGYVTKTLSNVSTADYNKTILNVQLCPLGVFAGFTASSTQINAGQNVSFTDKSVGGPTNWLWNFTGANPSQSTVKNPANIVYAEEGVYDVTLVASNTTYTDTEEKWNYILVGEQYLMPEGNINTCGGMFYDDGGPNHPYTPNSQKVVTFTSPDTEKQMRVTFSEFNINTDCDKERLEIYNGDNLSAPLIGSWCGNDSPGGVISSNDTRSLTIRFIASDATPQSGWKATLLCDTGVGTTELFIDDITVGPNPVSGMLMVNNLPQNSRIELTDANGRRLLTAEKLSGSASLNTTSLSSGLYFIHISSDLVNTVRKIIVK
ncbi:MAG: hypothetical protein A2X09_15515 [Bacteroidetes bacterium GWF2_43_11]|nr:MAG: hypothetical protein A2X09_15515 [Bacteroidetes bacterium GWF2_43_11]